ncbi:M23 family metallopeptidase [uncultured Pseudokineococcus sp.]|uniref:M23 family metallopeptidase n=1 Tax=uncultured Pseudokineococcus sp. TaxID=1642928 RepID=UPI00260570F7|nr:M23 family metallopeptidase [uncultured Pseudokineococcus sp.]
MPVARLRALLLAPLLAVALVAAPAAAPCAASGSGSGWAAVAAPDPGSAPPRAAPGTDATPSPPVAVARTARGAARTTPWRPPVAGPLDVLRGFTAPAQRWSPGHRGVDLGAGAGQEVLAPADGVVAFAGPVVDRGVLVLDHAGDLRSSFEPVVPLLAVGTTVRRGEVVALRAPTAHAGCATEGCLHWGVRRGRGAAAAYLDPLLLLAPPEPPVLLPLAPARPPG